jgi:hypothetical protein
MPKIARQKAWFLPGLLGFPAQNPDGFCIENDFVLHIIAALACQTLFLSKARIILMHLN